MFSNWKNLGSKQFGEFWLQWTWWSSSMFFDLFHVLFLVLNVSSMIGFVKTFCFFNQMWQIWILVMMICFHDVSSSLTCFIWIYTRTCKLLPSILASKLIKPNGMMYSTLAVFFMGKTSGWTGVSTNNRHKKQTHCHVNTPCMYKKTPDCIHIVFFISESLLKTWRLFCGDRLVSVWQHPQKDSPFVDVGCSVK